MREREVRKSLPSPGTQNNRIRWGKEKNFLLDPIAFEAFTENGIFKELTRAFHTPVVRAPLLPLHETLRLCIGLLCK